ncbi:MAG: hypothetical protein QGH94_12145, partial [Phycisphaerae bacterium]|nr:hypothetical protein [Phycisphaerae bacterium]
MFQRTIFTIALSITMLAAMLTVAQGADPEYYVKKATWQDTVQASREALVEHLNKPGKPKAPAKPMFGPWYEIGQYSGGYATAHGPEKKIDLSKPDGKLKWRRINVTDGVVHQLRLGGNSASYFYRKITSPGPAAVMSYYGSDDSLGVWLNGKKIVAFSGGRGPAANQNNAKLILRQGENHLLIKIHNGSGGSGWYFSTSEKGGGKKDIRTAMQEGIWTLAARDFNTADARKQMTWEQSDNVWAADWKKGDIGSLAKRYVSPSEGSSAAAKIKAMAPGAKSAGDLAAIRKLYYRAKSTQEALAQLSQFNIKALRLAITDLTKSYPGKYPSKYLKKLDKIEAA